MSKLIALARYELLRLFASRRGWLAMLAFVLAWIAVLFMLIDPAIQWLNSGDKQSIIGVLLRTLSLRQEDGWPRLDLTPWWWLGLYLLPGLVIILAADQIASDRARGTLRYLRLRSSRALIYLGRFTVQVLILAALLLFMALSIFLLFVFRAPDAQAQVAEQIPLIVINQFVVLLPYVALMSLLSVVAGSGRQAMWLSVIVWLGSLLLSWQLGRWFSGLNPFDYVFPGAQVGQLLRLQGAETLQLSWIPLLQSAVFLAIGFVLFQRRDL